MSSLATPMFVAGDRVTLRRGWCGIPADAEAEIQYVDDDHSIYVIWAKEAAVLGPCLISMNDAQSVLEVVR